MQKQLILFLMLCFAACSTIESESDIEVPVRVYEEGFVFENYCATHGSHTTTVGDAELMWIYTVSDGAGNNIMLTGESIELIIAEMEMMRLIETSTEDEQY